MKVIPEARRTD